MRFRTGGGPKRTFRTTWSPSGGAGLVVALLAVGVTVSQVGRAAQIDPATAIRGE
jgi:hypothetical protein